MNNRKKIIWIVTLVFTLILIFIVKGINIATITYHISTNKETVYSKIYYIPFWENEIELDIPEIEDNNLNFLGWYYDEGLQNKAAKQLNLKENIDVYAGVVEDNPETDFLLPEIHITSEAGKENIDMGYTSCIFTVTNTTLNYCLADVEGKIRGRGNSTWEYFDKKPYKIKFVEKQNLFGMGDEKEWVLLANAVDYTLMRNEIAFGLGRIMGLQYTPKCQWVQLFYNEEYLGLYLLCEQVKTGINRVNIEIPYEPGDVDISYFIELGGELDGFTLPIVEGAENNWEDYFSCEILYPESDIITKDQMEYISTYLQLVNTAILTKDWDEIMDLVDMDSFVDWYLVNEIILNGDMGWSMFAYKPQGDKLYLGPLWDFDQSAGVSKTGGANFKTWYPDTSSQHAWFNTLIELDEFKKLLAERWEERLPEIKKFLIDEQTKATIYKKDIDANYEKWPVLGTVSWRIREEIGELKTYEENTVFLFDWLEHRLDWIDSELNG